MQKAIAASLQDQPGILGGQISREDQEISRYVLFIKGEKTLKFYLNGTIKYQSRSPSFLSI